MRRHLKKKINNADIIFLMGGDTIRQFEFISKLNISEKIKRISGCSYRGKCRCYKFRKDINMFKGY